MLWCDIGARDCSLLRCSARRRTVQLAGPTVHAGSRHRVFAPAKYDSDKQLLALGVGHASWRGLSARESVSGQLDARALAHPGRWFKSTGSSQIARSISAASASASSLK